MELWQGFTSCCGLLLLQNTIKPFAYFMGNTQPIRRFVTWWREDKVNDPSTLELNSIKTITYDNTGTIQSPCNRLRYQLIEPLCLSLHLTLARCRKLLFLCPRHCVYFWQFILMLRLSYHALPVLKAKMFCFRLSLRGVLYMKSCILLNNLVPVTISCGSV